MKEKTNYKYFIGYLDEVIRLLVLVFPKMSGYAITFKAKDRDKDKSNTLMAFRIGDEKQLENIKPFALRLKT